MNKLKRDTNIAVSEVMGTILLLGISVSLFSVVYVSFFAVDVEPSVPTVDLIGTLEDNHLVLKHQGGEDLDLDTRILIRYNKTNPQSTYVNASDLDFMDNSSKNDSKWNIGESLVINLSKLPNYQKFDEVDVMVVDQDSNSAVMMGTLKETAMADMEFNFVLRATVPNQIHISSAKARNHGPNTAKNVAIRFSAGIYNDKINYENPTTGPYSYFNESQGMWYIPSLDVCDIDAHPQAPLANLDVYATLDGIVPSIPFTQVVLILDGTTGTDADWDMMIDGIHDWIISLNHSSVLVEEKIELTIIQFGGSIFDYGAEVNLLPTVLNKDEGTRGYYKYVANNIVSTNIRDNKIGGNMWVLNEAFDLATSTLLFHSANPPYNPSDVQMIDVLTNGFTEVLGGGYSPLDPPEIPPDWPPGDWPPDEGGDYPSEQDIEDAQDDMIEDLNMNERDQINIVLTETPSSTVLSLLRRLVYPLPSQAPNEDIIIARSSNEVKDAIENPLVNEGEIKLTIEAEVIYTEYTDPKPDNNYVSRTCNVKVRS